MQNLFRQVDAFIGFSLLRVMAGIAVIALVLLVVYISSVRSSQQGVATSLKDLFASRSPQLDQRLAQRHMSQHLLTIEVQALANLKQKWTMHPTYQNWLNVLKAENSCANLRNAIAAEGG